MDVMADEAAEEAVALADDEEAALAAEAAAPTDAQVVEQAAGLQPRPQWSSPRPTAADALANETAAAAAPALAEMQPVADAGYTTQRYTN